jgi:MFS family permease
VTVDAARPGVLRDFPTWIVYVQAGLFGWFLYAFGPSITLLRDEQGTSRTVSGLHGSALAVGAVVGGIIAPAVVRRIGRGPMMRLGSATLALGILAFTASPALPWTLTGALVASLGGTFVMVGLNAFIPDHQPPTAAPRAMSEAHGTAAAAGLLGPLTVGLGVYLGWGWRPAMLTVAVGLVIVELVRGRRTHEFDGTHGHRDDEPGHAPTGPMPRRFWATFAAFFAVVGVEFSLTLWGTDLLRDRGGLGDAAAAAALASIVGGMAVGRLGGAPLVGRRDPEKVLLWTLGVSLVGFAIAWAWAAPLPMLLGFFVAGLGIGLQAPLAIGRSVRASEGRNDRASGLTSVAAGAASGLAPFALGALADRVGVHAAFLIVPLLIAAALVLVRRFPVPVT